jgi:hypothetical protein
MHPYASWCDEWGVTLYLHSKLDMPTQRETILHFFETIQKAQPSLIEFEKRAEEDYFLQEDRDSGSYRWVSLDRRRLCCGFVNPPSLEAADEHLTRILELAPFHLDLSGLQTESLDVMYHFDLIYQGNHDQLVLEALGSGTPLEAMSHMPGVSVMHYQPVLQFALDETFQLQARLNIETRLNAYSLRNSQPPPDAPISVYLTVRQFWHKQPYASYLDSYYKQRRVLEELMHAAVLPQVLRPLAQAINLQQ